MRLQGTAACTRLGHALRKHVQRRQLIGRQIEDVIDFLLRNHQRVAFHQRRDVEKSQVAAVLGHFISRQLAGNDAGENRRHAVLVVELAEM